MTMATNHDIKETTMDDIVAELARKHFGIETLETRNMDALDFYDVAVWSVRDALAAAYEAGKKAKRKARA
jgi:hypothetical protein